MTRGSDPPRTHEHRLDAVADHRGDARSRPKQSLEVLNAHGAQHPQRSWASEIAIGAIMSIPFTEPRKLRSPVRERLKHGSKDKPLSEAQTKLPLTLSVPGGSHTGRSGSEPLGWNLPMTEPSA